jgi:hypothetical protein
MYKLLCALIILFTLAACAEAGIPGDADGNDELSSDELADAVLSYMFEGHPELNEIRDAAHLHGKYPTISAEWVMVEDPDIIVKFPFRKTVAHGYTVDNPSEMKMLRDRIIERPELANATAVRNGAVYILGQELCSGPRALIAVIYMAKWFHPELFKDLDPEAIHQEYLTGFQELDYDLAQHGVFVYPASGS